MMIPIKRNHLDMIRAIAWSFNRTTGFDYDELFAQGCLVYCEAILAYDNKKGTKLSTYAYRRVHNGLIHFIRQEKRFIFQGLDDLERCGVTPVYEYFNDFPADVLIVMRTALECAEEFEESILRWAIREALYNKGWNWPRIWKGIQDVKETVNQTEPYRIIL